MNCEFITETCKNIPVCWNPYDEKCEIICAHCGQNITDSWMINDCCLTFELDKGEKCPTNVLCALG